MAIKITGKYSGQTFVWHLCGNIGTLSGKNIPVSLYADKVMLPLDGGPYVDDLDISRNTNAELARLEPQLSSLTLSHFRRGFL